MKPFLSFVSSSLSTLALVGVAHAQVQFGGFRVGGSKPAQQQKPAASQNQPASTERAANPNQAATEAWRIVQREQGERLGRLHDYATNPFDRPVSSDQYAHRALNDLKDLAKLDEVKKGCAEGRYKGENAGVTHDESYLTAATMCPLVASAEEHIKKGLRARASACAESTLSNLTSTIDRVEKEKQVSLDAAIKGVDAAERRKYISGFVKEYFDALGEPVPEALLAKVDAMVAKTQKAIVDAAAAGKMEKAAGKDAGAERAIKDSYTVRHEGIVIKKVWLIDSAWKIKHSSVGLITNRYKDGSLLVKVKGIDGACLIVPAAVGQSYAGGGRYAASYDVDDYLSGIPVTCK